ncbi:cupin domain-containing protein [Variovorax sp. KK3]|uniref:cupin domain-containing protein n=1 Tax=Variovorax sp. KK3 TaxID=1855728 RepID=UPI0009F9AAFB|nr:cupin domain-containing protein [Variovorax sp. KK3]
MKTHTPSPTEMMTRVARFKDLKPVKEQFMKGDGIPAGAYAAIAADRTFILMGPKGLLSATGEDPPVIGGDGGDTYTINIATCPPGNGSPLHAHHYTHETFFCLNGRFEVRWGDEGEHHIFLEPFDMIAVPPGVVRNFTNVSNTEASLLVTIQGDRDRFRDVDNIPSVAERVERDFGTEVRRKLEAKGLTFTAGLDVALPIDNGSTTGVAC